MSFGSDDQDNPFAKTDNSTNPYAAPSQASMADATPLPQTGIPGGAPLATLGERFAGSLIDGIIMIPLALGVGFAMGFALVMSGLDPESPTFNVIAAVFGGLIGAGIFLIINGYLLATKGQTVGKLVMKTQIVSDETDTILPLGPLVLKRYVPIWIVSSLPFVGGLFGIANACAIFRENRKCIHDEIAGTRVIKLHA